MSATQKTNENQSSNDEYTCIDCNGGLGSGWCCEECGLSTCDDCCSNIEGYVLCRSCFEESIVEPWCYDTKDYCFCSVGGCAKPDKEDEEDSDEEEERWCENPNDCPYGGYIYGDEKIKYENKKYICVGCRTGVGLQEREQEEIEAEKQNGIDISKFGKSLNEKFCVFCNTKENIWLVTEHEDWERAGDYYSCGCHECGTDLWVGY